MTNDEEQRQMLITELHALALVEPLAEAAIKREFGNYAPAHRFAQTSFLRARIRQITTQLVTTPDSVMARCPAVIPQADRLYEAMHKRTLTLRGDLEKLYGPPADNSAVLGAWALKVGALIAQDDDAIIKRLEPYHGVGSVPPDAIAEYRDGVARLLDDVFDFATAVGVEVSKNPTP